MDITTIVVDDEPAARRRIRSLLEADSEIKVVGECRDGISAAAMIQQLKPALIFLDVQIPGADGFGVLKKINNRDQSHSDKNGEDLPVVVFVTAYREYAIPAFEARAFDYLLKPYKRSRFFEVLARAKSHIQRSVEYQRGDEAAEPPPATELLLVKSNSRLLFLRMSEIKWVEAQRDYVRLHLHNGSHFTRETMRNLQRKLDNNSFIRIHRSAIVNIAEIAEVQPLLGGDYNVTLRDKTRLILSRRYRSVLDKLLNQQRARLPRS